MQKMFTPQLTAAPVKTMFRESAGKLANNDLCLRQRHFYFGVSHASDDHADISKLTKRGRAGKEIL